MKLELLPKARGCRAAPEGHGVAAGVNVLSFFLRTTLWSAFLRSLLPRSLVVFHDVKGSEGGKHIHSGHHYSFPNASLVNHILGIIWVM